MEKPIKTKSPCATTINVHEQCMLLSTHPRIQSKKDTIFEKITYMATTSTGNSAAVFLLVLTIATNAAPPYRVGGFEQGKNEIDECTLLCVNEYLCACNVSDSERRNQCCQDYCNAKCGSGAIGSCGDLPKKPNC